MCFEHRHVLHSTALRVLCCLHTIYHNSCSGNALSWLAIKLLLLLLHASCVTRTTTTCVYQDGCVILAVHHVLFVLNDVPPVRGMTGTI
jgi:hypothetical protein